MESLVTAALQVQPSSRVGKDVVQVYIERLGKKIEEARADVFRLLNEKYEVFLPVFHDTAELNAKVQNLAGEMRRLAENIESDVQPTLQSASEQQRKLGNRLQECEKQIGLLEQLLVLDDDLDSAENDIICSNLISAAECLVAMNEKLDSILSTKCDAKIFHCLRDEVIRHRVSVIATLQTAWKEAVQWKVAKKSPSTRSKQSLTGPRLHLCSAPSLPGSPKNPLAMLLRGMQLMCILEEEHLLLFTEKLYECILQPLVTNVGLGVSVKLQGQVWVVSFSTPSTKDKVPEHWPPSDLFDQLLAIISILEKFFAVGGEIGTAALQRIGSHIWPRLSEDIIGNCLVHTIPKQSVEMESYQAVIEATVKFEKAAQELGLISCETTTLSTYAKNVNVNFANKKCEELLVIARDLMIGELHSTTLITPNTEPVTIRSPHTSPEADDALASALVEADKELAEGVLFLPTCKVSCFAVDVVKLVAEALQEATTATVACAIQLFYSVRNVIELYCHVVPTFHQRGLKELPEQSAIHHNNCFYLAHHLLLLGHQFRRALPTKSWLHQAATFIDLVPVVRRLGEDCFLAQMCRQQEQLRESLNGATQFKDAADDQHGQAISQAVQQVLLQLTHVARVWKGVLPEKVFMRSLSALLDAVLSNVVSSIIALEDISAAEATALHTRLSVLKQQAPAVFVGKAVSSVDERPMEDDLKENVAHWQKFVLVLTVLEASLQDIVNLWNQGKGTLAKVFNTGEVRSLIRALFKNTERRAKALNKIKVS